MPIDPSILLSIKPPVPIDTPYDVAKKRITLEEAAALRDERIATAQQRQQAEQDKRDFQGFIQNNLGPDGLPDFDKAVKAAYAANPRVAGQMAAGITATRKANAEADKLTDDHRDATIKATGQVLNDATEDNWAVKYRVLRQVDPQAAALFGDGQWTPNTAEQIKTFQNAAISRKDYVEQKQKADEYLQSGKEEAYVGQRLLAEPNLTPDRANDILREVRDLKGVSSTVTSGYAPLPIPQMLAKARNDVLGQKDVETLAETATRDENTATNASRLRQQTEIRDAATIANESANRAQAERHFQITNARLNQAAAPSKPIDPGTPDYKVAQDLAFGKMTPAFFRTLEAYNRDAGKKANLYYTASQINPNFNEADFERGFKFISNPKTGNQLAALDNALSGIPDLLKASDAAKRSGITVLNGYTNPVKVAIGSKTFSDLRAARTLWADEASGGLGFGTASDLKTKLGLDITDTALGPDNFRSAIEKAQTFLERKRQALLNEASVYGTPANNSSVKPPTAAELIRKYGGG